MVIDLHNFFHHIGICAVYIFIVTEKAFDGERITAFGKSICKAVNKVYFVKAWVSVLVFSVIYGTALQLSGCQRKPKLL